MGCKSSKPTARAPPVDSTFPLINHPDLDNFFQRCSLLLLDIETINLQINAKKHQGIILAGTSHLPEKPYTKAVQVLFWALSASQEGKISRAGVTVSENSPFISVMNSGQCRETVELTNTLQEYLLLLLGKPKFLEEWEKRLQEMKDEQVQMKRKINPSMSAKTVSIADHNMDKLNSSINASWRTVQQLIVEQKETMELLKQIPAIIRTCDEVGAKVHIAQLMKPAEIWKWAEIEYGNSATAMNLSETLAAEKIIKLESCQANAVSNEKYISFGDLQNSQGIPFQERVNNNQSIDVEASAFAKSGQIFSSKNQSLLKQSAVNHSKGRIFVIEKGLEIMIRDTQEEIKMSPDYLSPGGHKQTGILQGEENILDDEDTMWTPAHESVMIKSFVEKAHGCFGMKE